MNYSTKEIFTNDSQFLLLLRNVSSILVVGDHLVFKWRKFEINVSLLRTSNLYV